MSSIYDNQPLPEGRYYLVDISEPVQEYLALPKNVRICGAIMEQSKFTTLDMLDIELSSLIPVLDVKDLRVDHLIKHTAELLAEANERKEEDLARKGVDYVPDCQENTPAEKAHAEAIHALGSKIGDILVEMGLYDQQEFLRGEHVSVDERGMLYLRAYSRR